MCVYYILNIFYYYIKLKANVTYNCQTVHTPHLGHKRSIFYSSFFLFFPNNKTQADIHYQGPITAFLFGGCTAFPYRDSLSFTDQRYTNRLVPPPFFFWLLHNYFTYLHNKHIPLEVKLSYIKLLS